MPKAHALKLPRNGLPPGQSHKLVIPKGTPKSGLLSVVANCHIREWTVHQGQLEVVATDKITRLAILDHNE